MCLKNETPKQEGMQTGGGSSTGATNAAVDHLSPVALNANSSKKCKFGFPASQASNYSVADCRALVKTLVCGVKTITWGCTSCKQEAGGAGASGAAGNAGANTPTTPAGMQQKQFQPKETLVYIRLVKWAMEALDIYTLNTTATGQPLALQAVAGGISNVGGIPRSQPMQQAVRTKEEKEVEDNDGVLHKGIAKRNFTKSFTIADDVEIKGAELKDGMLKVSMEKIVPEAKKLKTIDIK